MTRICSLLLAVLLGNADAESVPFDDARWQFEADRAEIVEFAGKTALFLNGGRAWLPDVALADGMIEFDIAFGPERGFSGAMFRYQRAGDFENFYFRPHQSGKPDASQYTPELNGVSGWQLYFGPEYSAPFDYRYGEWMHVQIDFAGDRARVTLDGETLHIRKLKRPIMAGAVGLRSGFAPAHFANFRYSEEVPEDAFAEPQLELPKNDTPGLVTEWRVSEAFEASRLSDIGLPSGLSDALDWRNFDIEPEGFVNLARTSDITAERRTVLARFFVDASGEEVRLMRFGYSDRVRVYLNGREVYRGDNTYRTRDYRYLGTIGLFDTVPLQLGPGSNEVTFAVTEAFGGWGIMAALGVGL